MKNKTPIECEECTTIVAMRGLGRETYTHLIEGAYQTGMSKKYKGYIASFCKDH